jgi:hypothetical protein
MVNFDTVLKIGLTLAGVEESTAWGAPALTIRGKLLTSVPTHRSAEPGSLMVRVGSDDRAELPKAAPDTFGVIGSDAPDICPPGLGEEDQARPLFVLQLSLYSDVPTELVRYS